jgi:ubiquinone/menaquinone biosynthesis C-methylase UbiE
MRLNLGSGKRPIDGYVNVDLVQFDHTDVVCDLNAVPWPFDDESIEDIQAWHIFEHVTSAIDFMLECHRILQPGGRLIVVSPVYAHVSAFTDPTHRRFCTPETWDYWVPGTVYYEPAVYGRADFAREEIRLDSGQTSIMVILRKLGEKM